MVLRFKVMVALGKREEGVAEGFRVMVTQGKREGNGNKTKKKGGVTKTIMTTKLKKRGDNGRTRKERGEMAEQKKRVAMAQLKTPRAKAPRMRVRNTKSKNTKNES
jgi:hypothetical protein